MSTTVSDEPASYTSKEKGQAKLIHTTKSVRDASKSAVPELRRLSTLSVKKDLSDLSIPTITENAEDVAGLKGRIRLQKDIRRNSRDWMDQQRKNLQAYEYLCRIGEAKEWIEKCIAEEINPIVELEESLRNGIVLAKLARAFEPSVVKRIFMSPKLQFRHSDNINYFFAAIRKLGLPSFFWFELTDLYEKKNIPKVIYCIHALSYLLSRRGLTPRIRNLVGKLEFSAEQLNITQRSLDAAGVIMPSFANVGMALAAELNEPPVEIEESQESEEEKQARYWEENLEKVIKCQAAVRTYLARSKFLERRALHNAAVPFIIRLQAQSRGWLVRQEWKARAKQLEELEKWLIKLQAQCRGVLARNRFNDKMEYFRKNLDKIVKIQSFYRAKQAEDAYRSLTMGNNPPVGTIKNFIHLLDDKLERLRQLVIQKIRENNKLDELLNQLDIKIALLVKNSITLDEVIAVANSKKQLRRLSQLNSQYGPYSLKALDKGSRRRLDLYQQMFYLLQTQPAYLARLFFVMNKTRVSEKIKKIIEGVVLTLFGYAQNAREEYLLLKLFQRSIMEELESVDSLQEFLRGNFMFMKLVVYYNRGAKERKFLRDLLVPLVKHVMDDDYMDLETDPLAIYRTLTNAEEIRTGQPSSRPSDITQQDALNDPETRTVFIHHLQRLRKETETFLNAITASLSKMPYGIRYIARELKRTLMKKFPREGEMAVMKVVGHLVYYRYLNPAIVAPEGFDVIETIVSPMQRKNLAEISKMLNQISVGRLFTDDNMYLQPLNEYVSYATERFSRFFNAVTEITDPEAFFDIDEFEDLTRTHKPIIYITPYEIFSTHKLLVERLDVIAPQHDDPLRQILNELSAPPVEEIDNTSNAGEISLTLTSCIAANAIKEPDAEINHLYMETKRYILSIIRIQNGQNLLEILVKPVSPEDEEAYRKLCASDCVDKPAKRQPLTDGQMIDIATIKFAELKKLTLRNILKLEAENKLWRSNNYQDLLNSIAVDIRNKHRRRIQRQKELRQVKLSLVHLDEKRAYLDEQIKSYNDYIDACLQNMSSKKGKKRLILPFTRQYYHIRDLQKSGKVPKFGSYKYTAQRLHEKGVLISVDSFPSKQFDKLSFTISSDELGIFTIEAKFGGVPVPGFGNVELRLEDLLQSRFNNVQVMTLFGGAAKVNANLLIFLINKKFFV
ncbi:5605_t:CDS:10 [Paraglomus occultum]|uniref:5605_t:CDS:1 n=1 Tax=Paraglomus occultum TaxID=144539 RepID=A0A9N9BFH0_9GLOM|nr:5605_t:CDS:10 [Paraglomus occultum]